MSSLASLSDDEIRRLLGEHGSQSALANALQVPRSTLKDNLRRRGMTSSRPASRRPSQGSRLTRDGLLAALKPPNLCPVKAFLDGLDADDRELLDEAMQWPSNPQQGGISHKRLRQWLIDEGGFESHEVPSEGQIENHRANKGGCKCRD